MLRASQAFSQVAPVPDFSPGYACHRFVFPCRTNPSLTSFSGCGHGWLFPVCTHRWFFSKCACRWLFFGSPHKCVAGFFFRLRLSLISSKLNPSLTLLPARMSPSLTFFSSCAGRWPFSQVARIADFLIHVARIAGFFPGRARPWFFPRLRMSQICFSVSHESLADFLFRLRTWLVIPSLHPSLIFPKMCLSLTFFGSPHKCVAGFFFRFRLSLISSKLNPSLTLLPARMSPSLTFFSSCAGRWPFSQVARIADFLIHVARIADFFPGLASRWLFPRLSMSQIFFPCRTSPWLTSFSGCGHGWLFPVCARRWFFPKCACRWLFFGSPHKSVAGFFFRLRPSLISSKLNLSLTLLPARTIPSLTFFSACAGRWHFSQVAPVAFFNSCCAHRRLFPRSRPSLIFP